MQHGYNNDTRYRKESTYFKTGNDFSTSLIIHNKLPTVNIRYDYYRIMDSINNLCLCPCVSS